MHLGAGVDELSCNPHATAVAADAALEEIVRRQLASDLAGAFRRALEEHRRRARDDAEPAGAQPANLRDHFFGQSVAEVFLSRVVAHVRERQNDESHGEVVGYWLR